MTRFTVDLLHAGRIADTWAEWFVGPRGRQHLVLFAGSGLIVLVLGYVLGVYLPARRLARNQAEVARLRQTVTARADDLKVLKADLDALSGEARRQVRWSDLLTTLGEQLPPVLRLQKVTLTKTTPAPAPAGPGSAPAPRGEGVLSIEAQTPLRPGGPPLLETAKFMAGLMRDPAVSKRFQLQNWEIRPPTSTAPDAAPLLHVSVTLAERAP
jgi:hypothetical protein